MFDLLSSTGTMFVEFTSSDSIRCWIESMGDKIFASFPEGTDISVDTKQYVLRITKCPQ
jgi:hypothetical protein